MHLMAHDSEQGLSRIFSLANRRPGLNEMHQKSFNLIGANGFTYGHHVDYVNLISVNNR